MTIDPDLALVVGLGLVLLSSLSIVAAWIDARLPVTGGAILLIGFLLMVVALVLNPFGYSFGKLPDVIFTVLGRYVL
jgi:hypothetical protein